MAFCRQQSILLQTTCCALHAGLHNVSHPTGEASQAGDLTAQGGPALPVPLRALPLLLLQQLQSNLKLHPFQLTKVTDNNSSKTVSVFLPVQWGQSAHHGAAQVKEAGGVSGWEAVRRGADIAPFSIAKLLHISTAISQKLPLIQLLLNRDFG